MRTKKIIVTAALNVALGLGGAAAANAATQYPNEGGTWNYGLAVSRVYSDYLVNRCHGTTVGNDWGDNRSIDVAADRWANSAIGGTPWTNNKYYYRVC